MPCDEGETTGRTEAQKQASRENGKKGRGPRTDEGKARSRLNRLKHGMRAALPVLPGEDPEALVARRRAWRRDLAPADEVERFLADQAVGASWTLDRCRKSEAAELGDRIDGAGARRRTPPS